MAEDFAKKCMEAMEADNAIWEKLGIMCSYSSDPNTKTTNNSWEEYVEEVEKWVDANNIRAWSKDVMFDVYDRLENENYHSFRKALMEIL